MSENETFKYFKFKYILGDSILGKSKKKHITPWYEHKFL